MKLSQTEKDYYLEHVDFLIEILNEFNDMLTHFNLEQNQQSLEDLATTAMKTFMIVIHANHESLEETEFLSFCKQILRDRIREKIFELIKAQNNPNLKIRQNEFTLTCNYMEKCMFDQYMYLVQDLLNKNSKDLSKQIHKNKEVDNLLQYCFNSLMSAIRKYNDKYPSDEFKSLLEIELQNNIDEYLTLQKTKIVLDNKGNIL